MTAVRTRPRVLTAADAAAFGALLDRDPQLNCVLAARLEVAPDLSPRPLGGFLWGIDDEPGRSLRAAVFHGGNLIPAGDDLVALQAIGEQVARTGRGCSSIVGPAPAVEVLWSALESRWGPARTIRPRQPLLTTDRPSTVPADPLVRPVRRDEFEQLLPAAVAMFTEEIGVSPLGADRGSAFRARVAELIDQGRVFARFDGDGEVVFKAEVGARTSAAAQVQGVWVRPDLRGQGLGTGAMAAVISRTLSTSAAVTLYVNDYNVVARRMYGRLGLRAVHELSTVLF